MGVRGEAAAGEAGGEAGGVILVVGVGESKLDVAGED